MAKCKNWLVLYSKDKDKLVAVENKKPWQKLPKTIAGMKVVGFPTMETAGLAIDYVEHGGLFNHDYRKED